MANSTIPTELERNIGSLIEPFIPAPDILHVDELYNSIPVRSHGFITFPDNKSSRAEFVRIPPDASVMHVKELLNERWCNGRPSLVISVTGGAKNYNMKPKLLNAFRRGLLKVVRTTGAWVITGGMNTGIMKLVGEIIQLNPDRSRPIRIIGIGTWGCVSDFKQLDVHGANVQYTKPRLISRGEAPLQPNHTHFIFVDNEKVRKFGGEIKFRARLEQAIAGDRFSSRVNADDPCVDSATSMPSPQEQSDSVPVVLLVVEGGPNTILTVYEAVVENSIPAVFIDDTGGCCNLFAKALRLYNEYREKFELTENAGSHDPNVVSRHDDEIKNKLRNALHNELEKGGSSDSQSRNAHKTLSTDCGRVAVPPVDNFELVYACIHTRQKFLNVVSLNSSGSGESDIDLAILQALLNATSGNDSTPNNHLCKRKQFQLALEWNRVDIVKTHIMKNDQDWETLDLNEMFIIALKRNQTEFVKLFLDHDLSLTDVFHKEQTLRSLYVDSTDEGETYASIDSLRDMYREIIQWSVGNLLEVDLALCVGQLSPSDASTDGDHGDDSCSCWVAPWASRRRNSTSGTIFSRSVGSVGSATSINSCIDVDKALFFWSVIKGRREFNLLFWSRVKNKICAALIATLIYRKRAHKDNDNSYSEAADEFEDLAVQILNKFYQTDPQTCTEAIIRQIPSYGNTTWLQLAIAAEAKEFIAQRAIQGVLNNIWFGCIDQSVADKKIIIGTIFIWYSGFLLYNDNLVNIKAQGKGCDGSLARSHVLQRQQSVSPYRTDRPTGAARTRLLQDAHQGDRNQDRPGHNSSKKITRDNVTRYFGNILTFTRAPCVKYMYHLYFHVIFLLLFSYVILCDFFPLYDFPMDVCAPPNEHGKQKDSTSNVNNDQLIVNNPESTMKTVAYGFQRRDRPATTEIILAVWVFTLLCEEIRQLFSSEARSMRQAIAVYFEVFWNKLDVLAIILFYVGFILRFVPSAECFCAARIALSVDLTIWFIRSMDLFTAVKRLGPKLVMIGEMIYDLKFFMIMLTVFILGFGISSYSLIHGAQEFTWHLPREIINLAYWEIFGDLNTLDAFENNYKANGYAVFVLTAIYMSMVSILLVNLLIAMFSNTFDRLQNDTDRIWKFQRYSLICEYLTRPSLPPPFILFSHIWRLILYILSPCAKSSWLKKTYEQHTNRTKYKTIIDDRSAGIIEIAEDALGDEVYYSYLQNNRNLVDDNDLDEENARSPQDIMLSKIRTLENRIQNINNQQTHMFEYLECLMNGLKELGGERIRMPKRDYLNVDELYDDQNDADDQASQSNHPESFVDNRTTIVHINSQEDTTIDLFPPRRDW